mgnify:CR=1 FL=1
MAFDLQIKPDFSGSASELEKLVARAIGSDPVAAAAYAKQTVAFIETAKNASLRITAARLRKALIATYEEKTEPWPARVMYSNWFGRLGPVSFAELLRANRPIGTTYGKQNKQRKRGYSQQRVIKPPVSYPVGGKLPKATIYEVDKNKSSMRVGVLTGKSTRAQRSKMIGFQNDIAVRNNNADPERTRRYLAALGIYIRKGTVLRSPARPVFEPVNRKYPADKLFESAFIDILTGKLEARD